MTNHSILEIIGLVTLSYVAYKIVLITLSFLSNLLEASPKKVIVELKKDELSESLEGYPKFDPAKLATAGDKIYLWDPSTFDYLGETKAMNAEEVKQVVLKARKAQEVWKKSSFC